jgi:hypothetical protein
VAGLTPLGRFDWERIIRRIDDERVPFHLKGFAFLLASYGDSDGTNIRPGDPRLMAVTGKSSATVRRWRDTLIHLGLIEMQHRGGGTGQSARASMYRLTVPDDLLEAIGLLDPDERPTSPPPTPLTQMSGVPDRGPPELRSSGNGTPLTAEGTPLISGPNSAHSGEHPPRDQEDQPHTKELDRHVGNARASEPPEADPEYDAARRTLMTLADFGAALIADLRTALPNGDGLTDRDACVTAAELIREKRRSQRRD